jgi:hypothetical protein
MAGRHCQESQTEKQGKEMTDPAYPYVWRVRTRLPERKGQRCRVLVRSRRMNSALIEFTDGYKVVTSRNYIRKAREPQ